MGLLDIVESPFKWMEHSAEWAFSHVVPPELQQQIGIFAHTFVANLVHDAGEEAKTLTKEGVHAVWTCIETTAGNLAPAVLAGKVSFGDAVAAGVKALKSDVAATMVPTLKLTAEQTIKNWLPNLITTSLAASTNPTSSAESSSAGSSSGSSGH